MIAKAERMPAILERWLEQHLPPEFFVLKNLLVEMLRVNPEERVSAKEALNHPFFTGCRAEELEPAALPRIAMPECYGVVGKPPVVVPAALMRPARVLAPVISVF